MYQFVVWIVLVFHVGVEAAQKNKTFDAVHEKTNVNEEERATAYKWSSTLADWKSKLFPSPLEKWIKAQVHPTDLYATLRLAETSTNLEHASNFNLWLKYVDMYRAKKGNSWFWDSEMVGLFRNTMPDDDVVRLIHILRQNPGMKDHADRMQIYMFTQAKDTRKTIIDAWLRTNENPMEVFNILQLKNAHIGAFENNEKLFQWLKYTIKYRAKSKDNSFQDTDLVQYLKMYNVWTNEAEFATLFQVTKEVSGLKAIGESMQTIIFKELIMKGWDPTDFAKLLAIPYSISVLKLSERDPRYKTLEAFLIQFVKERGGNQALETVKSMFVNGDLAGALAATKNLS
ncbi:RxLR effector protein [Phytophthora megakarya]|uniref:RxLR effector protein n=1 Tax=Phytophthora megakarya TaxID=4795 RepID=A0A225WXX6_9STRA|nr:RxLR effector protein [Phytophthora megakarya]